MEVESVLITAGITFFALALLIISLASYKKHKNTKLLLISLVFFVLFIKGMILSIDIFLYEESYVQMILCGKYAGIFDLAILILLFGTTLKRLKL